MKLSRFLPLILLMFVHPGLYGQQPEMELFTGIRPRNIGPAGMSGRVTAIAVHPINTEIFYIGTASGGLWKTTSGGTVFEPVFDRQNVASIGALAIDPLRPDIIYAGTGEGNPRNSITGGYGLYKSIDGGKTWELTGLEATRHIHRIIINPINSDIVYAGAIGSPWAPGQDRGVYKTSDGGKTWTQVLFTNETSGVADMVMDPENPDKIFVAMWDHQRWPWFFNSGGDGSGIYLSRDGGKNFVKLTGGLPANIGRVGLAIAASRPDYVYAYVESDANAIYRSVDGGVTWEKRGEKDIGNRPFYYADIYVDPENENRVYTLFSGINMSEDGALTFPAKIARSVHLDHHAWWINPDNPRHIIDGNDGGMAISYDRGNTWRHITNLPVGQFYHIAVDNERPYNVYGGMQDNGSWRGPAYAWTNGGLINEFWDFLIGGDGFDAIPVPDDPRYCYAQSQGGALRRVDLLSGETKSIKPAAEKGERLRFNWNAALAQDPFDNNTIYFGSQFVHKSTDRGDSWEKISPDLTSDNPDKLKQRRSGGLTVDATGAENHCTILAISPSPLNKDVIWAGTDDGRVHITQNGGSDWEDLSQNIKGMPEGAWIPQLKPSPYSESEAYLVVNNYRQGDYSAYLYRTVDYGKSWERIINDEDVWGYMLCFVQDPLEENLMFAGTEYGLYLSFDKGSNWSKWTAGYPTVSTYDLAIHPREHDLIIGTFGRSVWIIDDIQPLREIAASGTETLRKDFILFTPPDRVIAQTKNLPGYYYRADAFFMGENRRNALPVSFWFNNDTTQKLKLEIYNADSNLVRTLEENVHRGINRVFWNFDMDPPEIPGIIPEDTEQQGYMRYRRGAYVLPGKYTIVASVNNVIKAEKQASLINDPRMPEPNLEAVSANLARAADIQIRVKEYNTKYKKFRSYRNKLTKLNNLITDDMSFADEHNKAYDIVNKEYNRLFRLFTNRREGFARRMFGISSLYTARDVLSQSEEKNVEDALMAMDEAEELMDSFADKFWADYIKFFIDNNITLDKIIN